MNITDFNDLTLAVNRVRNLLKQAMTVRVDDCEIFMKGIDYSYYYEQED